MRTRAEILDESYKSSGGITGIKTHEENRQSLLLEVLLDIRDLLSERRGKKVISTEVPMTEKEQKLLDGINLNG